jgi:hypothetical protein
VLDKFFTARGFSVVVAAKNKPGPFGPGQLEGDQGRQNSCELSESRRIYLLQRYTRRPPGRLYQRSALLFLRPSRLSQYGDLGIMSKLGSLFGRTVEKTAAETAVKTFGEGVTKVGSNAPAERRDEGSG